MKKLWHIVTTSLILSLLTILAVAQPVQAIDPPVSVSIDTINVYRDLIETGDHLYLIKFNIKYTTYPTDESADQVFIIRLFRADDVEVGTITPFNNPYFHSGFGQGAISLYYTSSEVASNGMVWGSSMYARLEGNPFTSWNGTAPTPAISNISTWTTDGGTALGNRVLGLAITLQSAWGAANLLVNSGTLTATGENYFISIIPQLRLASPTIFSGFVTQAQFYERSHGLTYVLTLRSQWSTTWLDMTQIGSDWGIDPIWILGIGWTAIILAVGWLLIQQTKTTKFLTFLVSLMIIFGLFAGFYGYVIGGILTLASVLALVNQLFYSKSYT